MRVEAFPPLKEQKIMTLEEAIKTAIAYETKIQNLYQEAQRVVADPVGKRIFKALADDEQNHVAYLQDRLEQWRKTGALSPDKLETTLPEMDVVSRGKEELSSRMEREDRNDEKQMLSKALSVEIETSNFYEKMVSELQAEGRRMFARFLEIEAGHIQIVQAELDFISHTGYWFDFKEFDMEEL
ncbi:MAG: ferritin family protein [Thermodesulfobacteriota bacterium]